MIQVILIGLLLAGAAAYLGRLIFKSFTSSDCATGCGKCAVTDIDKNITQKTIRG